jgi:flagellar motor switch protein FliN/FliY
VADDNDDLLNPDEIEALLKAGGAGSPTDGGESSPPPEPPAVEPSETAEPEPPAEETSNNTLDPSEIEALLQQSGSGPAPDVSAAVAAPQAVATDSSPTENLLNQAEADLATAIAPNLDSPRINPAELENAEPFEFQKFASGGDTSEGGLALNALQDIELNLHIELGRTELLIEEVLTLKEGSVVPLDKLAGDPVDILINGRLIARGEVLVLNDNFCVRVAEILTPDF